MDNLYVGVVEVVRVNPLLEAPGVTQRQHLQRDQLEDHVAELLQKLFFTTRSYP